MCCTFDIYLFNIILATSFGIKVNAQAKKLDFNKYLQRTHEIVSMRISYIYYYSDIIFRLSPHYGEDKFVRQQCLNFGNKVNEKNILWFSNNLYILHQKQLIEERKQMISEMNKENVLFDPNNNTINETDECKPKIFVDQVLNSEGNLFSESDIRDHVFTTVSAVSF